MLKILRARNLKKGDKVKIINGNSLWFMTYGRVVSKGITTATVKFNHYTREFKKWELKKC